MKVNKSEKRREQALMAKCSDGPAKQPMTNDRGATHMARRPRSESEPAQPEISPLAWEVAAA